MEPLKNIIKLFEQHQNEASSIKMAAYMKGHFKYYGINSPLRKEISKPIIAQSKLLDKSTIEKLIKDLWQNEFRELHHLALDIAVNYYKNNITEKDLRLFEWLASKNQWWDSIDVIEPKLMGKYLLFYPEKREMFIDKCIATNDFWLIRCAILFQLKYKTNTDLDLLFETIKKVPPSKEFFINKAIGWVLRENTRLFPEAVVDFVRDHDHLLSNLSKKEALRLLH